jgi:hypothetical protein
MKTEEINARNAKHYWDLVQSIGTEDNADNKPAAPAVDEEDDEEWWVKEYLSMPSPLPRLTLEEMNEHLDRAEAFFDAGLGISDEEVWRELEAEFAEEDACRVNLNVENDYMLEAV